MKTLYSWKNSKIELGVSFLDGSKAAPLNQQFYMNGMRRGPEEERVLWRHFVLYVRRDDPHNLNMKHRWVTGPWNGPDKVSRRQPSHTRKPRFFFPPFLISSHYCACHPPTHPPTRPRVCLPFHPATYRVPPVRHYYFSDVR